MVTQSIEADSAAKFTAEHIAPTLTPALVELCRARPADPVSWLAEYLLANKPPLPEFSVSDAFRDAVVKVFQLADEDGSGALDFSEVRVIATAHDEAIAILEHLDKDKDGAISLQEWTNFFMTLFSERRPMAEMLLERSVHLIFERDFMMTVRALFDAFDKDGSGTLELPEVLLMAGDDEEGSAFLNYADGNEDKALSLQEWMRFFFGFWRVDPQGARHTVGFLMQRAAELASMPALPPPPPAA